MNFDHESELSEFYINLANYSYINEFNALTVTKNKLKHLLID
mgnify:CR=1 FL=1